MKLYELPRNTKFTIPEDVNKTVYLLDHIDGMYSYCLNLTTNEVVHVIAWQEVETFYADPLDRPGGQII